MANIVAGVVQTFTNATGSVVSKIIDFAKGVFSSLNNAVNIAKNAVGGAVSTIGSWFRGISDTTPEDAVPNTNEGDKVNRSTSALTGLLNWRSALNLIYIQNDPASKGYVIAEKDIN